MSHYLDCLCVICGLVMGRLHIIVGWFNPGISRSFPMEAKLSMLIVNKPAPDQPPCPPSLPGSYPSPADFYDSEWSVSDESVSHSQHVNHQQQPLNNGTGSECVTSEATRVAVTPLDLVSPDLHSVEDNGRLSSEQSDNIAQPQTMSEDRCHAEPKARNGQDHENTLIPTSDGEQLENERFWILHRQRSLVDIVSHRPLTANRLEEIEFWFQHELRVFEDVLNNKPLPAPIPIQTHGLVAKESQPAQRNEPEATEGSKAQPQRRGTLKKLTRSISKRFRTWRKLV
ncbi:hypothetical protein K493DRAFT_60093 [Basidiobolus meristosporus CBS 931.73]|uniref:Uncharacterized protein n=1 Tax=Basidiobolus meristosporus CBS 931.73 TaxID=1314790 RepID=A0A1Y1XXD7_9FUNG|nr:hypothetical protein K493DRAFT_60093 [Basidiobolus meristosporus CBS 931.73]|eukprot:ORX90335.1 hypothetical protein K493DRAFT_60093 [Basidiobolus meristosporus CBS 931.73]